MKSLLESAIAFLRTKYPAIDDAELNRRAEMLLKGVPVRFDGGMLELDTMFDDGRIFDDVKPDEGSGGGEK